MAVYKVPQDVEADDKLIGPFSFRQFVFVLIMVGFLYMGYLMFILSPLLVFIPVPFIIFFAALAFPWRKDQPTEVYLTALIHFWMKPRKRIWNQEGHTEHVIITVPKKIEHQYTDGLSSYEVKSRLHGLAATLDSRGWATKNVALQEAPLATVSYQPQTIEASDRLAMPKVAAPVQDQAYAVTAQDDVMDEINNPVAQNFNNLVAKATEDRKQAIIEQMKMATQAAEQTTQPSTPAPTYNPYPNMQQNVVQPASQVAQPTDDQSANQPINPAVSGAILNLANNSDLSVSTIAREAEQALHSDETIELH